MPITYPPRTQEAEDLITRTAFIFWTFGYLPDNYKQKLEDMDVDTEWFISHALMFHPNLNEDNKH